MSKNTTPLTLDVVAGTRRSSSCSRKGAKPLGRASGWRLGADRTRNNPKNDFKPAATEIARHRTFSLEKDVAQANRTERELKEVSAGSGRKSSIKLPGLPIFPGIVKIDPASVAAPSGCGRRRLKPAATRSSG